VRGGTPQGCQNCYFSDRWYRFAQPPANCFSAFGAHCRFDRGNADPDTTERWQRFRSGKPTNPLRTGKANPRFTYRPAFYFLSALLDFFFAASGAPSG
jgi:hypothetical protein